jgi:Ca2+-binding RTX toxin-like protein
VTLSYNVIDGNGGSVAANQSYTLAAVNDAPTGLVTISGNTSLNQILTAANSLADADGLGAISYQWQSSSDGISWSNIIGALSSNMTLSNAQVGQQIRTIASYTDNLGTAESVASLATGVVINSAPIRTNLALPGYAARLNLALVLDIAALQAAVLPGFVDPESTPLILDTSGMSASNGSVTIQNGAIHFAPAMDFTGVAQLTLNISDGVNLVPFSLDIDVQSAQIVVDSTPVTLTPTTLDAIVAGSVDGNITGNDLDNNLTGNIGNDTLNGGAGNDKLDGGLGNDKLDGGDGNDLYLVDSLLDTIIDSSGVDTVQTTLSHFELSSFIENLNLRGNAEFQIGKGNDKTNIIDGSVFADRLFGGSGGDVLSGGAGQDNLDGGTGADIFRFNTVTDSNASKMDRILDFMRGIDKIDVSGIDANNGLAGDQAFQFIGSNDFSHSAGELRFASWKLSGDVDGDGNADFVVRLVGVESLSSADIVL